MADDFVASGAGWPGLFWEAFTSSRNAMVLLDERRCHVEVNGALLQLLGYRRSELIGHPIYEYVVGGPVFGSAEWRRMLGQRRFTGKADVRRRDGALVRVEFAGHPETVTGRRLILGVAMRTSLGGRRLHGGDPAGGPSAGLSSREREVVRLIAQGLTGSEIGDELQITHNTVRKHASNAMAKLGARSRAQLVATALAEGIVHAGPPALARA